MSKCLDEHARYRPSVTALRSGRGCRLRRSSTEEPRDDTETSSKSNAGKLPEQQAVAPQPGISAASPACDDEGGGHDAYQPPDDMNEVADQPRRSASPTRAAPPSWAEWPTHDQLGAPVERDDVLDRIAEVDDFDDCAGRHVAARPAVAERAALGTHAARRPSARGAALAGCADERHRLHPAHARSCAHRRDSRGRDSTRR